ncbi:transglycosylase SLT domain-containing protein [Actinocorallia aurantiaca]|uniref:Transglycosylase SLT domain-containing protein n=1 Tax=Actinocorallia aurantiaca TaxID=46204 RepID=A0ABN3U4S7_9ACTN
MSTKTVQKKRLSAKQRNKAIARKMLKKRGMSDRQYRCLAKLWTKESNWNHRAYNSSSGAGGIPQALPASKMSSAGSDWRTNPKTQIKWGLRYIKGRYGTPCGAWAHFLSRNWY